MTGQGAAILFRFQIVKGRSSVYLSSFSFVAIVICCDLPAIEHSWNLTSHQGVDIVWSHCQSDWIIIFDLVTTTHGYFKLTVTLVTFLCLNISRQIIERWVLIFFFKPILNMPYFNKYTNLWSVFSIDVISCVLFLWWL